jgi:23S rRNA (guanine745-N1)-methyltransferase
VPSSPATASLPPALVDATAVLACPSCRGSLEPEGQSLVCREGHRFDVARRGNVWLDVGPVRGRPEGDDRAMVNARRAFLAGGALRAVTEALADAARGSWVLDVGAGTGHHVAGVLDRLQGARGVGVDVSRHALVVAARRHPRLAAVGADVWRGLPLRTGAFDLALVVFAPRNAAELHRVLRPDGRLLVATPAPGHLRELLAGAPIRVDPHKSERLARQLGDLFEVERSRLISDRVSLEADAAAALTAMGPWARHDMRSRPLEAVTVAVQLTVHRPRP